MHKLGKLLILAACLMLVNASFAPAACPGDPGLVVRLVQGTGYSGSVVFTQSNTCKSKYNWHVNRAGCASNMGVIAELIDLTTGQTIISSGVTGTGTCTETVTLVNDHQYEMRFDYQVVQVNCPTGTIIIEFKLC